MEETASLAKFMELILDEKLPDETKESDNRK
jgi:hypothetical protein